MSTSISCPDCEHDFDDHNDLAGCAVRQCPCTESKATMIELTNSPIPRTPRDELPIHPAQRHRL